MPFQDFYFFFQFVNFIFKMFFGRFTFVKKGALVAKFTSGKLAKIPADPGVPHEASLGLAGEAGAGVDDVLLLAAGAKFTVTKVVKGGTKVCGSIMLTAANVVFNSDLCSALSFFWMCLPFFHCD